ncbi:MAG: LamG-like jellyroll fold domain-containing protein [Saprospiraceae bacterium]
MKGLKITLLLLLGVAVLNAQPTTGQIAYYSFDACDASDDAGNGSDGNMFGNLDCGCGVSGQALKFDGIDDYVTFSGVVNSVFQTQDFTLSFYFKTQETSTVSQDIISKRTACNDNSMFNIEYIHNLDFLTVDAVDDDVDGGIFLSANAASTCWHHCIIIRDGENMKLYLDGQLKTENTTANLLNLENSAPLTIGNSPCINQTISRFKGLIDEMYVYNVALRPDQLIDFDLRPDMIGNRDTILFTGNSLNTFVPNTCATNFLWSPIDGVDDPTSAVTTITPEDTAAYVLRVTDDNFCVTYDTLQINVINPEDLPCDEVFLPKAFTPNGDLLNDTYSISNPNVVQQLRIFEIYDRWGTRVFVTDNPFEFWDGTYNGTPVNPGVFIWKIEYSCENKDQLASGTVTIIR